LEKLLSTPSEKDLFKETLHKRNIFRVYQSDLQKFMDANKWDEYRYFASHQFREDHKNYTEAVNSMVKFYEDMLVNSWR